MTLLATIRNAPDYPAIGEIDVYDAPASGKMLFKIANGSSNREVVGVAEDPNGAIFNGQPYLWFQMKFPGNMLGWVRDEYIDLEGDATAYGVGMLTKRTSAFELIHGAASQPTESSPSAPESNQAEAPAPTSVAVPLGGFEPLIRAALDITATFEGGYASYQNHDSGIVSYGRFQFTLAGGALYKVVSLYIKTSTTDLAKQLNDLYLTRIRDKDAALRTDNGLKDLLRKAAQDEAMRYAQDEIAKQKYWNLVQDLSIQPRGLVTPLSQALIFDMAINHGSQHDMLTLAEETLGLQPRGKKTLDTERPFTTTLANIRKDRLYKLADKHNYGGLKVRADFWVNMIAQADWDLQGDAKGLVYPKPGREVKVR
ncbi:MAG: chitosanase [Phototrophicaceae bacterium]